jgi:hypothetical protein
MEMNFHQCLKKEKKIIDKFCRAKTQVLNVGNLRTYEKYTRELKLVWRPKSKIRV